MKRYRCICAIMTIAALSGAFATSRAADAPAAATPPAADVSEVKPAGPGVFSAQRIGATRLHLVVAAHTFTSREDAEKYLAYRAAAATREQGYAWFSFIEHRAKGDKVPVPKADPKGLRYSFRLEFFRPLWRYKTAGATAWKSWSPFSGDAFWADGVPPKSVTDYEVSADIVVHKGEPPDDNPLAFDAGALSDFLINQVEPPK